MDIKKFGPQRNSRSRQGAINPACLKKLFEGQRSKPVIYRSSWERKFITWCETCRKVRRWGSECVGYPYVLAEDGTTHTYFPDFFLEMENGDRIIVEIKPYNQVCKPDPANEWACHTWIRNMSKWMAIRRICEGKGIKFWLLTERTISKI